LRKQKVSPLDAKSIQEHLENVKHRGISEATEDHLVQEVLRYHGRACRRKKKEAHQVLLTKLVVSYEDMYSY